MTRNQKHELVETLANEFSTAGGIVVCEYKGMTVKHLEALRNLARPAGLKVKVVKNTLATLALEKAGKGGMDLKETNLIVWGEDMIATAKGVMGYAKNAPDFFKVRGGVFDGEIVDAAKVTAYSKLASREELIAMLLFTWNGVARKLVTALDEIKKQKEAA